MSKKFIILASVLVVFIATIAVAIINSGSNRSETSETADVSAGGPERKAPTRLTDRSNPSNNRSRDTERQVRDKDLVAEYGEARTNLARHVSGNVVSLLDDVLEMGEMAMNTGGFGGGQWQLRQVTRRAGVELNDEQREKLAEIHADYQKRELERTRQSVESLRTDPSSLMSMVLAGDARARGQMTDEQYAALQRTNAESLAGVINPLDRNNFRGSDPLDDPEFRSSFIGLLDADQAASFSAADQGPREATPGAIDETNITQMPAMELESLDTAVGAAKQMTSGIRQAMEGMGNLGPLIEQMNRNRPEE